DNNGKYIIILEYAKKKSLRKNLYNISQMDWKKKLILLHCITSDLQIIHSHGYIHRDLHSGNILQDNLHSAYISDLGLSILNSEKKKIGVSGILPYVSPEVLGGSQYATASDVYSFGIIMWEILYGSPVFYDRKLRMQELQIQICCSDLRPPINKEAPRSCVNLMKECWDNDPKKRPSAEKLCE
ncbi:kinase-like domain-containing protein, partial [Gigaspora rosea]